MWATHHLQHALRLLQLRRAGLGEAEVRELAGHVEQARRHWTADARARVLAARSGAYAGPPAGVTCHDASLGWLANVVSRLDYAALLDVLPWHAPRDEPGEALPPGLLTEAERARRLREALEQVMAGVDVEALYRGLGWEREAAAARRAAPAAGPAEALEGSPRQQTVLDVLLKHGRLTRRELCEQVYGHWTEASRAALTMALQRLEKSRRDLELVVTQGRRDRPGYVEVRPRKRNE